MRVLHIHAHFDDYEFAAAGLFEIWRRKLGTQFQARVLVCTDGKAGHHFRSREETMQVRIAEQDASAKIGHYDFRLLRYPNGEVPREACLQLSIPLLAALWKEIRDFEPDYIFCPPYPAAPLAGVHVDHVTVSEAVRKVAYMINVPHAFTPEYPSDESNPKPCKVPVILNDYDAYMFGSNAYDLAIDVEDAFESLCQMTWCHQSQIAEWLPWVGRHEMAIPKKFEDWVVTLRNRFKKRNREMGIYSERVHEFYTVTAWGQVPVYEQLITDFPNLSPTHNLKNLKSRLQTWRGEGSV